MSLRMNNVSEAILMSRGLNKKIVASVQNNGCYSVPSRNDKIFLQFDRAAKVYGL